jgi:hypothetical protein
MRSPPTRAMPPSTIRNHTATILSRGSEQGLRLPGVQDPDESHIGHPRPVGLRGVLALRPAGESWPPSASPDGRPSPRTVLVRGVDLTAPRRTQPRRAKPIPPVTDQDCPAESRRDAPRRSKAMPSKPAVPCRSSPDHAQPVRNGPHLPCPDSPSRGVAIHPEPFRCRACLVLPNLPTTTDHACRAMPGPSLPCRTYADPSLPAGPLRVKPELGGAFQGHPHRAMPYRRAS